MALSGRRLAIQGWDFLRTAWLILGISVLLLLFVETCYRVQRTVRDGWREWRAAPAPAVLRDPQESASWYADFTREYDATRPQRWKSYLYWGRRPGFRGTYVNIDSAGHRVTPQPTSPTTPAARVFFFGGSTMWGTGQRDDHTIAAEAARRLQAPATAARGGVAGRIEVTNFGESGYVGTQELLELMLALRAGDRPDVVVFYDGINDVGTTVQYGKAGIPQNEWKRAAEFAMGRALDRTGFEQGLRKDLHALATLGWQAFQQLAVVEDLRALRAPPAPHYISADSAARSLVRVYVENVRVIEALAKEYGFIPLYVWQPSIHSTQKTLTPFEGRITAAIRRDPFQSRLSETQRAVPPLLDPLMAALAPGRFVDADTLFRGDTLAVYLDRIGHTTEAAVPRIVDSFWPQLRAAVARRPARVPAPATSLQRRPAHAGDAPRPPSSARRNAHATL